MILGKEKVLEIIWPNVPISQLMKLKPQIVK